MSCHSSTKWLARVLHVVVLKTKGLHFKTENTPIKDTNGKRKLKRMLSFFFCGQTKAFRYEIFFLRNSTSFSTRRIGALGLSHRGFWRHLRYIPYSMIKEKYVLKGNFCIYKGFMNVFYILTSAWKKKHKMCIWNWFFAMCSTDLTCVNATI